MKYRLVKNCFLTVFEEHGRQTYPYNRHFEKGEAFDVAYRMQGAAVLGSGGLRLFVSDERLAECFEALWPKPTGKGRYTVGGEDEAGTSDD